MGLLYLLMTIWTVRLRNKTLNPLRIQI